MNLIINLNMDDLKPEAQTKNFEQIDLKDFDKLNTPNYMLATYLADKIVFRVSDDHEVILKG